jgi:hypothetical protein
MEEIFYQKIVQVITKKEFDLANPATFLQSQNLLRNQIKKSFSYFFYNERKKLRNNRTQRISKNEHHALTCPSLITTNLPLSNINHQDFQDLVVIKPTLNSQVSSLVSKSSVNNTDSMALKSTLNSQDPSLMLKSSVDINDSMEIKPIINPQDPSLVLKSSVNNTIDNINSAELNLIIDPQAIPSILNSNVNNTDSKEKTLNLDPQDPSLMLNLNSELLVNNNFNQNEILEENIDSSDDSTMEFLYHNSYAILSEILIKNCVEKNDWTRTIKSIAPIDENSYLDFICVLCDTEKTHSFLTFKSNSHNLYCLECTAQCIKKIPFEIDTNLIENNFIISIKDNINNRSLINSYYAKIWPESSYKLSLIITQCLSKIKSHFNLVKRYIVDPLKIDSNYYLIFFIEKNLFWLIIATLYPLLIEYITPVLDQHLLYLLPNKKKSKTYNFNSGKSLKPYDSDFSSEDFYSDNNSNSSY